MLWYSFTAPPVSLFRSDITLPISLEQLLSVVVVPQLRSQALAICRRPVLVAARQPWANSRPSDPCKNAKSPSSFSVLTHRVHLLSDYFHISTPITGFNRIAPPYLLVQYTVSPGLEYRLIPSLVDQTSRCLHW